MLTIVGFFLVEESKSALPTVMLKCEVVWDKPENDTYWNKIRFTYFYDLNGANGIVTSYWFNEYRATVWEGEEDLEESKDLRYLFFKDSLGRSS